MNIDMMKRRDLMEEAPDADLLREMIALAVVCLMELEVGAVTVALTKSQMDEIPARTFGGTGSHISALLGAPAHSNIKLGHDGIP